MNLKSHKSFYIIINIFIPFMAAYFLSELFRNINGVVGPNIEQELKLDATDLGFLTSLFFISIAGSQIFIGISLDRYGARRTVSSLLLIGAIGSFLFASGHFGWMSLGRFLLGLGMAGCWTAAFKVNAQWWPQEKLALANGAIIGFAGIGALSSTLPTEYLLTFITWQSLFVGLSMITTLISLYIFFIVPDHPEDRTKETKPILKEIKEYKDIFKNPTFIWFGPISIICQGVWLAYQGLWAGAWLRQVNDLTQTDAAFFLLILAISVIAGNFLLGAITDKLGQKGHSREAVSLLVCAVYVSSQILILMNLSQSSTYLWAIFGLTVSGSILTYALLTNALPTQMAGRAVSILNLFATLAGFILQYSVGVILDLWGSETIGSYPSIAHKTAFAIIIILQILTLLWAYKGLKKTKLETQNAKFNYANAD